MGIKSLPDLLKGSLEIRRLEVESGKLQAVDMHRHGDYTRVMLRAQ